MNRLIWIWQRSELAYFPKCQTIPSLTCHQILMQKHRNHPWTKQKKLSLCRNLSPSNKAEWESRFTGSSRKRVILNNHIFWIWHLNLFVCIIFLYFPIRNKCSFFFLHGCLKNQFPCYKSCWCTVATILFFFFCVVQIWWPVYRSLASKWERWFNFIYPSSFNVCHGSTCYGCIRVWIRFLLRLRLHSDSSQCGCSFLYVHFWFHRSYFEQRDECRSPSSLWEGGKVVATVIVNVKLQKQ